MTFLRLHEVTRLLPDVRTSSALHVVQPGLLALLLAITLGFLRNANVGILCLGFAIVKVNSTLELLAKKLLGLVGKRVHLIPVVFFISGVILRCYRQFTRPTASGAS